MFIIYSPKWRTQRVRVKQCDKIITKKQLYWGNFNIHNEIWGIKKTDKKGKIIESILHKHQLCIYNNKSNTYLHPATSTYSVIDLTICDPNLFLNYNWKIHDDICESDHFPILFENSTGKRSKITPNWNLEKVNWDGIKTWSLAELNPESNKNSEESVLYFKSTAKYSWKTYTKKHIPKSSTTSKHNMPWFHEECKKSCESQRNHQRLRKKYMEKLRCQNK